MGDAARLKESEEIRALFEGAKEDKARETEERKEGFEALQEDVRAITEHLHGMGTLMSDKFSEMSGLDAPQSKSSVSNVPSGAASGQPPRPESGKSGGSGSRPASSARNR